MCSCNPKGLRSGGGGGGVTLIWGTSCIKPIKALPGLRGTLTDGAANQLAQRHVLRAATTHLDGAPPLPLPRDWGGSQCTEGNNNEHASGERKKGGAELNVTAR